MVNDQVINGVIEIAHIMNEIVDQIAPISKCHAIVKRSQVVLKATPVARVEDGVDGLKDLLEVKGGLQPRVIGHYHNVLAKLEAHFDHSGDV